MGGLDVPLNIFLFQEIQRIQAVLTKVRHTLTQLRMAIKGEVVLTTELVNVINDIFDAKVPHSFIYTLGGDEFSWILPTLGLWFSSLGDRYTQYNRWLQKGRPNTFWITGFFNPQGFLTAMKQEVTRQHKSERWALNDVVYHSEVTSFDSADRVNAPPKEGVYIHGLFMDGARWDSDSKGLAESRPKVLFDALPVLHVTGVDSKQKLNSGDKKRFYSCPCYKYSMRTDRYIIFEVPIPAGTKLPSHWILRGVSLLCSVE